MSLTDSPYYKAYLEFVRNPPPSLRKGQWVSVTGDTVLDIRVYETLQEAAIENVGAPDWCCDRYRGPMETLLEAKEEVGEDLRLEVPPAAAATPVAADPPSLWAYVRDFALAPLSWLRSGPSPVLSFVRSDTPDEWMTLEAHSLEEFWEDHPEWEAVLKPLALIIEEEAGPGNYTTRLTRWQRHVVILVLAEVCARDPDLEEKATLAATVNRLRDEDDADVTWHCRVPRYLLRWHLWCAEHAIGPGLYVASFGQEGAESYVVGATFQELGERYGKEPRFYCDRAPPSEP